MTGTAVAISAYLFGCVPARPACELGAFLRKVDIDTSAGGTATGSAPPSAGVDGVARGSGSADLSCGRICQPGQLLRAFRPANVSIVQCLPSVEQQVTESAEQVPHVIMTP